MKVLQIGKFFHPHKGGIETFLKEISSPLSKKVDLQVLVSSSNTTSLSENIDNFTLTRAATYGKVLSLPLSPKILLDAARIIKEFKPDIIHTHVPNPWADCIALFSHLQLKPKIVVHWHSDIIRQKLLFPLLSPMIHKVLNECSAIAVPSKAHIRASLFLPKYENKTHIIPLCLSEKATESVIVDPKTKMILNRIGKAPFLLSVGRLVYYKGFNVLIEAMQEVNAHLVIVGEGPLRSELEATIHRLNVESKVHLAGELENIEPLFQLCTCFVLPSIAQSEGFGVVLLEAMRARKPLISTKLGTGVEIANKDGVTGLAVEPSNVKELTTAINTILSNNNLRMKFGEAAFQHWKENFTTEKTVDAIFSLYKRILKFS
ncbi:MAG: glycosyltransferase [Chloroherpetonaceae bacterium]|nr:glycosyltransferase [Chloroherpetonaceae bacterium]